MGKKRKHKAARAAAHGQDDAPPSELTSPELGTEFGPLLARAGLDKLPAAKPKPAAKSRAPAPSPSAPSFAPPPARAKEPARRGGDLSALQRAYLGVQPIARPKHARPPRPAAGQPPPVDPGAVLEDAAARERLSRLVAEGVRFAVTRDAGFVRGLRAGVSDKLLRGLDGASFEPEATLDLHGMRSAEAGRAVHDFVRGARRRGARHLLLIVGKGTHSDDGVGVLGEVAVRALTQGGAAPLVAAFASAHARHGGSGAIAVLLG
jgi:DNA-nicking Smr family endonuclease